MVVTLTPELERRIAQRVASGLYLDASEVVRDALRILFAAETPRTPPTTDFASEDALAGEAVRRDRIDDPEARRWIMARFDGVES